ncbi:hypothetical protein [Cerasicoccus maritimus]|uniref:hypothetical protein n=1 Tax=Cerasicoccus maritimus TaxID=490089 RepID=UPI002852D6B8|nr:hypothetical protein [Cerasicoccus maritimus]
MKNILKFGATCALILGISALPAKARGGHHNHNDEALAALGGFIGGVILSESLHDHQPVREEVYVHYEQDHGRYDQHRNLDRGPKDRFSKYSPRPGKSYDKQCRNNRGHEKCGCGGGRWKVVERRVYVPVSYTWRYNSCGVKIRVRQGGCYKTVRERIWIGRHRSNCRFG